MKTVLSIKQFKELLPDMLRMDAFMEVSWVTGVHSQDKYYNVGHYITKESTGDWTNHPRYSGTRSDKRADDVSYQDWIISNLPADTINLTVYHIMKS